MSGVRRPFLIDPHGRGLFAILHEAPRPARAAVLVCPPFLHEYARSHRLFALLADALAAHGIATLRFDYHGTGDSAGDSRDFSLDGARSDARFALHGLRDRVGAIPLHVLGVRAGAFMAQALASEPGIRGCWLWQPVMDGRTYLEHLRDLDLARRKLLDGTTSVHSATDDSLVGFPCSEHMLQQLAEARISPSPLPSTRTLVLETATESASIRCDERIVLDESLGDWVDEIDIGPFTARPVRALAERLATCAGGR